MITAEEFVVKIKANIKEAEKSIDQLKKQLKDTETVDVGGKGQKSSFREYLKQSKAKRKEAKELKKAEKEAGDTSAKSNDASIKAMGKMAVVAGIAVKAIKAVTKALQEGLSNAYQFSKATGGSLATSLDKLSSKAEAIKNGFGSIMASFVEKIEPFLSNILDSLFDLISKASKFVAQLMGNQTYLKANKDIMKQWDKNVKQTRTLLGMDELQIIQQQDTAPENLFTEVALDKNDNQFSGILEIFGKLKTTVSSFVNSLKTFFQSETFQKIKSSLTQLGTAIGELVSSVLDFLKKVFESQAWQDFLDFVGKIFNLVVSAGTVVVTFISDLFKWLSGDMTFKDVIDNLGTNIVSILSDPAKAVWHIIKMGFIDVIDAIAVWWNNLWHADIEHTDMWYENHPESVFGLDVNYYDYDSYMEAMDEVAKLRAELLMATAKPNNSPYVKPDIPNMTEDEKRKLLEEWAHRGFGNASGGVFTKPSLALIGEYAGASHNPEIVTPENILQANLDANNQTLITAFSQLTRQILQAIANVDMSVTVGDSVIAQSAKRGADQFYRLTGQSLFN